MHSPLRTPPRHALVGLAFLLAACAGQKQETRPTSAANGTGAAPVAKGPAPISTRAQVLFEEANSASQNAKVDDEALARKYDAALAADGRLAEANYNLGVLAQRQGNLDSAIAHYKAALKSKPSLRPAAQNLAVIAENRGDTQSAIATYGDIARLFPEDGSSRAHLAALFLHSGDPSRALSQAKEALARDPKSALATKVMLEANIELKQYSVAQLVFLRASKLSPDDPEVYYDLGRIHLLQKHEDRARAQFEKALEVKGDYAPALAQLAQIALSQESYSAAVTYLRKLLQVNGKNPVAHLNLGVAYKGLGQFDPAMQEYDAAQKLDPNLAPVYLNRGILLSHHKDAPERAKELFNKYIALKGGETALSHSDPVFGLIRETDQAIAVKAAAKKVEDEAKAQAAAAKAAEAAAKAKKEADAKAKKEAAAHPPAAPGAVPGTAPAPAGNKGAVTPPTPASGPAAKAASPAKANVPAPAADTRDEPGGGEM
jgi:tetratricopeptide (TPR) repeat protein